MALLSFSLKDNNIDIIQKEFLNNFEAGNYKFYYWGLNYGKFPDNIKNVHRFFSKLDGDLSGVLLFENQVYFYRSFPGITPLYYTFLNNKYYISDRFSNFPVLIKQNSEVLNRIKKLHKVNRKYTIYKNIRRFIPGGYVNINNKKWKKISVLNNSEHCYKSLLTSSLKKRTDGIKKIAIFLSEGLDSGLLYEKALKINKEVESFSIIFDSESKKIIENRVGNNKSNNFDYQSLKNEIKKTMFNSKDYIYSLNSLVFKNLLEKAKEKKFNRIILGISGDEIHKIDFIESLYKDFIIRLNLYRILKHRKMILKIFKKPYLKLYKKSFLKYQIKNLFYSSYHMYALEMIWMFFTEKDIYPVFPYLDKNIYNYVMNIPPQKILRISKNRAKARKLSYDIYRKHSLKKSFENNRK